MKVVRVSKDLYKIYLNKFYYKYDKETINECIKKVLVILKKRYNLEIYSNIKIRCYINNNYGIIMELEREYEPFSLYTKKTNLELYIYDNTKFLYMVDDYFIKNLLSKYNIYKYKKKYYIELLDDNYLKIIEFVNKILYGEDVKKIINQSA